MPKTICSIDGCEKGGQLRRGWCKMHYNRWQRHGDPLVSNLREFCTFPGCGNKHCAQGYCTLHYQRWSKYGDATVIKQVSYENPDLAFADRTEWQGDCLVWTGPRSPDGYGRTRVDNKGVNAHRYAWEQAIGPIPDDMVIDHICWNRACVNVEHLRLATYSQNCSNLSRVNPTNKSTGLRNVYFHKRDGNFRVVVGKNRKVYRIGTYETIEEAARAASEARARLFGEFAGRG